MNYSTFFALLLKLGVVWHHVLFTLTYCSADTIMIKPQEGRPSRPRPFRQRKSSVSRVTKEKKEKKRSKKKSSKKTKSETKIETFCGVGTEYDEVLQQCVIQGRAFQPIPMNCEEDDALCYCDSYGYGSRGPKLGPHVSCQKYVSCYEKAEGNSSLIDAQIMTCEPGYAYDVVAQVCFFKESVDCQDRYGSMEDLGVAVPSQCLSVLTPDDPVCGCGTYIWNSATLVPDECYGKADIEFTCDAESVVRNDLEIGIGDGIRPGRAPDDFTETAANTGLGYLDAPWLQSESNPDAEYPYKFPLNQTALIMVCCTTMQRRTCLSFLHLVPDFCLLFLV